jgi:hypothetical protein
MLIGEASFKPAGVQTAGLQSHLVPSISSVTCSLMEGLSASTCCVVKPGWNIDPVNVL